MILMPSVKQAYEMAFAGILLAKAIHGLVTSPAHLCARSLLPT